MLNGISLQGGAFDGNQIRQVTADSPVNNPLPTTYVAWTQAAGYTKQQQLMQVPLYSDTSRQNMLPVWLDMPVASKSEKQQYLLAGLGACIAV